MLSNPLRPLFIMLFLSCSLYAPQTATSVLAAEVDAVEAEAFETAEVVSDVEGISEEGGRVGEADAPLYAGSTTLDASMITLTGDGITGSGQAYTAVYTGKENKPAVSVKVDSQNPSETTDYTVEYEAEKNFKDVDEYKVTVKPVSTSEIFDENETGVEITFSITQLTFSDDNTEITLSGEAGSAPQVEKVEVTIGGGSDKATLQEGDFDVAFKQENGTDDYNGSYAAGDKLVAVITSKGTNCTGNAKSNVYTIPGEVSKTVELPTANPEAGEVASGTQVTLNHTEGSAEIYYITSKTENAATKSAEDIAVETNKYSTSIEITEAITIYAVAKVEEQLSGIAKFEYTIKSNEKTYPETWHVLDFSGLSTSDSKSATYDDGYFVINSGKTSSSGTIKSNNVTVTNDNINKLGWDIGTKAQSVYQTEGKATSKSSSDRVINFTISSNVKVTVGAIAGSAGRKVGTQKKDNGTDTIDGAVEVSTSNLGEYIFYLDASASTNYIIASDASIMICYVVVEENYEISKPTAKPDGTSAVKANTKVALSSSPEDGTDINIYWTYEDTLTKESNKYKSTDKYNAETNQPEITEDHKKVTAVAVLEDAEGNIRKESTSETFNYEITDGPVAEEINIVTPTATVNSGIYSDSQTVSLSSDTKASDGTAVDVDIYYTTDGTNPKTSTTKTKYTTGSTISVDKTMTIKAYATKDATEEPEDINTYNDSSIATYRYIIKTDAKKKYELLVAGEDEKVVPSEGQSGFGDDVVLGTDGYYNVVSAAGKSVIGTVSTIKGTVNGVKDTPNYNIETLRATWPEEAGVLDATTKAITLTGGKMQDGNGTQVVNAIKIFVSASEKASVTVYYACKTPASDSFDGATLDVYKSNSFDDTLLGTKVSGITTEKSTSAAVSKATFDLTEAGVYYLGFSADGGIIPYMEVTENPAGEEVPDVEPESVEVPTLDPYDASKEVEFDYTPGEVTITPVTEGSKIKYVTDKDEAVAESFDSITADAIYTSGTEYNSPIQIETETKIKAIAYYTLKNGETLKSEIVECTYKIKEGAVTRLEEPTAGPAAGAVEEGQEVELKTEVAGGKIFYTINGDEPTTTVTETNKLYDGNKIVINEAVTIKAIVATFDGEDIATAKVTGLSPVATFAYTIKSTEGPVAVTFTKAPSFSSTGKVNNPHPGDTLTVDYTLSVEGKDESTIEWYRGTTKVSADADSNNKKYTIKDADVDSKIKAVVTPNVEGGTAGEAKEAESGVVTIKTSTGEGLVISLNQTSYTYTGSAIIPDYSVTYDSNDLIEGIDYTVKFSNNVKVADNKAKITVTGKGNLSGSTSATFNITQADIADVDSGDIIVAENAKASIVLSYNGVKLTAKDFVYKDAGDKSKKWTENGTIEIEGNGNFKGETALNVEVISKAEQNNAKIKVTLDNAANKNITYDGEAHYPAFTVSNKAGDTLEKDTDYIVSYPEDVTSAGTKKFTIIGTSKKCVGTVSKSYTIKPALKDGTVEVTVDGTKAEELELPFVSTGVTFDQDKLQVTYNGEVLTLGTDYKITYSSNKKAGTGKYTVTGQGNYKGVKKAGTFTIAAANLDSEGIEVIVPDKLYTKANAFKSTPVVIETATDTVLKSSNYKVTYCSDENGTVLKSVEPDQTVYVKIEGKGGYAGSTVTESYTVKAGEGSKDLSAAKIKVFDKSGKTAKFYHIGEGEEVKPDKIVITYKDKTVDTLTLGENDEYTCDNTDANYTVNFVSNINKGKATVIIEADGTYAVGGKTATFNIAARNLKEYLGW